MTARRTRLADGRWHWQHGPIDLVIQAQGDAQAVAAAHEAAWRRFSVLLNELVGELPALRRPVTTAPQPPWRGAVARRMWQACAAVQGALPQRPFITPMAAVAGAVAQELAACYARAGIERAWINNGGDIALHLGAGASVKVGVFSDLARFDPAATAPPALDGRFEITADMPVRGVATSGWRGRSFSLGIADSVTVLAPTAALADAAATLIANAVDVPDAAIRRLPASQCKDDSDLGDIPVTVGVPPLAPGQVHRALDAGTRCARQLQAAGLVHAAALACQQQWRIVSADEDNALRTGEVAHPRATGSVLACPENRALHTP